MPRIYIIGTVASGKSYIAKKLSKILKIKNYELDDIFWERKYNHKRKEKERDKLFKNIYTKKDWVIEGVYASWVEEGLKRSNLIIFLDIPLYTLIYRITKRTITREKSKRSGERRYKESLSGYLGLIKAVMRYKNWKKHPTGYYKHKELIAKPRVRVIVLKNRKQVEEFLNKVSLTGI